VVAKEATRGELVTPERVLFTVADLAVVWLWIDVYERDLRHVRAGDTVEAHFDAWPGETFAGELVYLADELDASSRTVKARADLRNPDRRLKPGMFARVTLGSDGDAPSVLAVPRAAVQRHAGEAMVFVATGDGRFERRPVAIGRTTDDWVEILQGLDAGEPVVTAGAFLLKSQASAGQLGGHHH
jgi:membrane fusion protein, heavy metal efflux system